MSTMMMATRLSLAAVVRGLRVLGSHGGGVRQRKVTSLSAAAKPAKPVRRGDWKPVVNLRGNERRLRRALLVRRAQWQQ
jgi:hypothetical protein